ncbi:hypothetical protein HAX54_040045 [Datura stramonium]|uniref:Uncharacterized protein n=1 Tax=Datura stramonium TaxID=4076 RepID=A0ABS8SJJ5_DATST|nr:hypothetical protein [Datura stramonium]
MGALPPDSAWTPQDDSLLINVVEDNNLVVSAEPSSPVMEFEVSEKSVDANNILGGAGNSDDSQLLDYELVDPVIDNFDISDYLFNGNDDEELLFVGLDGNETIDVTILVGYSK